MTHHCQVGAPGGFFKINGEQLQEAEIQKTELRRRFCLTFSLPAPYTCLKVTVPRCFFFPVAEQILENL